MNNGFTRVEALALYDSLVDNKINAILSYSHYERMAPADNYQVNVPVGPGRMLADQLRLVMTIADDHNADCHLLGNGGITIFKR